MVDVVGEFGFPGEDVSYAKVGAGWLGLEKDDLFPYRQGDLFVPAGVEVFQEFIGFVYANKKAGEKAVGDGEGGRCGWRGRGAETMA
jgi:hypothetical protein